MPAAIPFITASNAAELAKLSWVRRREKAALAAIPAPAIEEAKPDAIVTRIAHAIDLTLDELEDPETSAKDRQALATSLRSLRETYHMVTGDALPGRLKPQPERKARYWERPEPPKELP